MTQWPLVNLGELVSFRGGGTPRKDNPDYWSNEIPWATVKDFKGLSLGRTQDSISRQGLESSASNLIPAGHVIIPTRMALGKASINAIDLAINQDLRALIPKQPLDPTFLLHAMLSLADVIVQNGSGATVKGITQAKLSQLQIPRPPLAEQKRIAKILDAADALRAKRRESFALLDTLLQSTFLDMFGDPVTNPMGWETPRLGEVFKVKSGNGLVAKDMAAGGEFPVYGGNGINGYHDAYMFEEPKIILGRVGVYCGVVHLTKPKAWITDNALYVREFLQPIDQTYLVQSLKIANLNQYANQAAQPLISGGRIYPAKILLPTPDLQHRFAAIVKSVQQQKTSQRAHLAELDTLFASLQQRAFRGDL